MKKSQHFQPKETPTSNKGFQFDRLFELNKTFIIDA